MRVYFIPNGRFVALALILVVMLLAFVLPVVAQETPPPEPLPDYTSGLPDFLVANAAILGVIVAVLTQALKWLIPTAVISAAVIQALVTFAVTVGYIIINIMRTNEGIDLGTLLITLIGTLLTSYVVSSGLYDAAKKLPSGAVLLNGEQGKEWLSLERRE